MHWMPSHIASELREHLPYQLSQEQLAAIHKEARDRLFKQTRTRWLYAGALLLGAGPLYYLLHSLQLPHLALRVRNTIT